MLVISNHKDLHRIWNSAMQISIMLLKLPLIVIVYFHKRKNGSEKDLQVNPYDKNETNMSIKENASKKIEQNASGNLNKI